MRVLVEENGSRLIELDGERATIGRARTNAVVLGEKSASREHCSIERRGDEAWLVDLGSRNGTGLNGSVVRHSVKLAPGDRIEIGAARIVFEPAASPGPDLAVDPETELASFVRLQRELARRAPEGAAPGASGPDVALVRFDIDALGLVNQLLGMRAGDAVVVSVAKEAARVAGQHGPGVLLAREAGGKLAALVEPASSAAGFAEAVRRAVAALEPGAAEGRITVSAGVACAPEDGRDWRELLRRSEASLAEAKQKGRDRVVRATLRSPADGRPRPTGLLGEDAAALGDEVARLTLGAGGKKALALVASVLGSDLPLDALVRLALSLVAREVGAERGVLLLLDSSGSLRVAAALDASLEPIDLAADEVPSSLLEGVLSARDAVTGVRAAKQPAVVLAAAIVLGAEPLGAIYLERAAAFGRPEKDLVRAFARLIAGPVRRGSLVDRLTSELERARLALGSTPDAEGRLAERYPRILGRSAAIKTLRRAIDRAAPSPLPVLVTGESGTGKELVARALHDGSKREGSFVAENCAALPETLLEAELFGVRRGAFTGAEQDRPGLFAAADGGTLFLDEVGEMTLALQAKVLRAIETGEVRAVGADAPRTVSVRVVAATNRDLKTMVEAKEFRADLFFRLAVLRIEIPPLRARREDVTVLARHFAAKAAAEAGQEPPRLTAAALRALAHYTWPGNVRELENEIRKIVALGADPVVPACLSPDVLRGAVAPAVSGKARVDARGLAAQVMGLIGKSRTLDQALAVIEREAIERALAETKGNRSEAARRLRISRPGLHKKMRRFGIE